MQLSLKLAVCLLVLLLLLLLLVTLCCREQSSAMQELTNDRLGSEADLNRLLGALRYLQSLKVAQQAEAAAGASQDGPEQQDPTASASQG